jgi:hypothetical protein
MMDEDSVDSRIRGSSMSMMTIEVQRFYDQERTLDFPILMEKCEHGNRR